MLWLLPAPAHAFDMMQAQSLMQDITVRLSAAPNGEIHLWLKGGYVFSAEGSTQRDCYKVNIKNTEQIDTIMAARVLEAIQTNQTIYSRDWDLFFFVFNKWLPTVPVSLHDPWCLQ